MKPSALLFLPLILLLPATGHATQAMAAPECSVKGIVLSQNQRFQERHEDLTRHWGIPNVVEYNDITLKILENDYTGEEQKQIAQVSEEYPHFHCENTGLELTYQLREENKSWNPLNHPEELTGKCISATTNFSGDEFVIGNWLYNVTLLPPEECNIDHAEKKENNS